MPILYLIYNLFHFVVECINRRDGTLLSKLAKSFEINGFHEHCCFHGTLYLTSKIDWKLICQLNDNNIFNFIELLL